MSTALVNVRLEPELKKNAEELFAELGLSMTAAINLFLRQAVRSQSIPFTITLNTKPNEETMAAIREAIKVAHDPKAKTYTNARELFEDLDQK